ncbi:unnamed protein product [Closterium sp. Naga37s-1]|nr:unnamed protein product [Closterium sp. Naga37s-1]
MPGARGQVQGARRKGPGARGQAQGARRKGPGARGQAQGARRKGPGARGQAQGARRKGPGARGQAHLFSSPSLLTILVNRTCSPDLPPSMLGQALNRPRCRISDVAILDG